MTLKDRIIRLIETGGPIPVSTYMQLALHDSAQGYYATRPGLGTDFITAPEVSQVFGELIGLWVVNEWRAMGAPDSFHLVEIGPGRGTLMADALRLAYVAGDREFADAAKLTLVEPSPELRKVQAERLSDYTPSFADTLGNVPAGPMILVANEYLDCLPARQFRKADGQWRECVVGLDADGALAFGLAADEQRAPDGAAETSEAVEVQIGFDLLIADLLTRPAPMRALFIDYGPADATPGDSLRAFSQGEQVSPLAQPGETDLTVDVDFGRLKRLAARMGLDDTAGHVPDGAWRAGTAQPAGRGQSRPCRRDLQQCPAADRPERHGQPLQGDLPVEHGPARAGWVLGAPTRLQRRYAGL
mgnify:CR=1 FL=1